MAPPADQPRPIRPSITRSVWAITLATLLAAWHCSAAWAQPQPARQANAPQANANTAPRAMLFMSRTPNQAPRTQIIGIGRAHARPPAARAPRDDRSSVSCIASRTTLA